jgi:uncharacterized protein with HEPN domain
MSRREDWISLTQIRDSASEALQFSRGKSRADLDTDRMLSLALTRLLEIIGEAAGRVTPSARERLPQVPWNNMIGMRNRIIHRYDEIKYDVVWQVIEEDLPMLVRVIEASLPGFMPPGKR